LFRVKRVRIRIYSLLGTNLKWLQNKNIIFIYNLFSFLILKTFNEQTHQFHGYRSIIKYHNGCRKLPPRCKCNCSNHSTCMTNEHLYRSQSQLPFCMVVTACQSRSAWSLHRFQWIFSEQVQCLSPPYTLYPRALYQPRHYQSGEIEVYSLDFRRSIQNRILNLNNLDILDSVFTNNYKL